jgi:hypothetical protein
MLFCLKTRVQINVEFNVEMRRSSGISSGSTFMQEEFLFCFSALLAVLFVLFCFLLFSAQLDVCLPFFVCDAFLLVLLCSCCFCNFAFFYCLLLCLFLLLLIDLLAFFVLFVLVCSDCAVLFFLFVLLVACVAWKTHVEFNVEIQK